MSPRARLEILAGVIGELVKYAGVPYSAKFSRVFNFADFMDFQPFVKVFQQKFVTHGVQCARVANS